MNSTLPIVERFHSIQGEGAHVGRSAFFIRLAKCEIACPWCDTKQSWSADRHPKEKLTDLAKGVVNARINGAAFVVITGGEPLHHNLDSLCRLIRKTTATRKTDAMPIHLETSGVDPLSGDPDWITLSPKKHAPPKLELINACNELKIVIHQEEDLMFAENMAKRVKKNTSEQTLLFLQPGWNNKVGGELALEYVKKHPEWRLSLQTHKWLGVL